MIHLLPRKEGRKCVCVCKATHVYLLEVEVDVVDVLEKMEDCSRFSNSERKRVISSSILRISESNRSRIELNSESKTLKSPNLMGIMFLLLSAIFFLIGFLLNKRRENRKLKRREVSWKIAVSAHIRTHKVYPTIKGMNGRGKEFLSSK